MKLPALTVQSTSWLLGILHLPAGLLLLLHSWQAGLAAMIALHALLLSSTLGVHSRLFGAARRNLPDFPKGSLCLTIDDGPCADTPLLLDILDAHQAKAVFFLIGERAAQRPGDVREILRRGHLIANHTQTHPAKRFWAYGPRAQRREITACQEILTALSGGGPALRLFRAPAGFRNPFTAPILREQNLEAWSWQSRGFDTATRDIPLILQRLTRRLHPGAILLIHQGQPHHPELLRQLLQTLSLKGWRCVLPSENIITPLSAPAPPSDGGP